MIEITKKDIAWSYIANIFSIASGIIVLPVILNRLDAEEVGLNYIMLTISSLVSLLDFGFAPQFGRNFTYVNSGVQSLRKEGIEEEVREKEKINYHLLSILLATAKTVYQRISVVGTLIMLSGGTAYIAYITNGFTSINNSLAIWILFTISTYFNIYFTYYNSLLTGSGKVEEANVATFLSKLSYILICIPLLLLNVGLLSIVIANLIAPFIRRYYSYKKYYTREIRRNLEKNIRKEEIKETFNTIWYNSKKLGINFIGAYAVNKSSMFIIGFFLPLSVVGSYGILTQIATLLLSISQTLFTAYEPKYSYYRVTKDTEGCKNVICLTTLVYLTIMIIGSLGILFLGPAIFSLIHSKTVLPSKIIMAIYLTSVTLEGNHSNFATLIAAENKIPFVKSGLISGLFIIVLTILCLEISSWGLLGVVLIQFAVQLSYNNWRWPKWILDEYKMNVLSIFSKGFKTLSLIIRKANDKDLPRI